MRCKDVMTTKPVCCTPEDTATRAAKLMKTEDVGSLPVCEGRDAGRLVGIVTDRDLTIQVIAAGKDPGTTRIGDLMTRNPVTCREEDDLETALNAMESRQIRRITVVDGEGRLTGIIAQADIARRGTERAQVAELVEEVSRPSTMRAG
jgi:CBS domain-containing protein